MAVRETWNPETYLAFDDLRTRPAADLLNRVHLAAPETVYDLGCGPGNSTALLRARWPEARLVGVDNSPTMLERAHRDGPKAEWLEADLTGFTPETPADLLFSNAAYHWVAGHGRIFQVLMNHVKEGGALAVQMPANFSALSHVVIRETAPAGPWAPLFEGIDRRAPVHEPETYFELLNGRSARLDLWCTEYMQVLTGPDPVLNWVKGTALTPYLDRLRDTDLTEPFLEACAKGLRAAYPPRSDGVTLFPFRRLFFVAWR